VTVEYADAEPSGLASMIGELIDQNLARDPSRARLLRPSVASITAPDAGVSVMVHVAPRRVVVADGEGAAHLRIAADSGRLLELTAAPLRFGFPDAFSKRGRAVLRDVLAGRVRIGGMLAHPARLVRLTMLLSVR
jgi:hypothetical protein